MKESILILFILLLITLTSCNTTVKERSVAGGLLKKYDFHQLDSLLSLEERPIAVFLHADWCKFCKNMKQTTFQNKEVIALLNNNYYFFSFDGENKNDVFFHNNLFRYQPLGRDNGKHELASSLGTINGELAFPTFVILNSEYEIIFQYNSFLTGTDMAGILEKGML
jgi:thioredoxin-related protein